MKIEKVSKYIIASSPSRSMLDVGGCRKVLLSMPRVRWLERDSPSPEPPSYIGMKDTDSYISLTKMEETFLKMVDEEGMTVKDVARKRRISVSNVHKMVEIARGKMERKERAKLENKR